MDVKQAQLKQLDNISARTGKSLDELKSFVLSSGLEKHTEVLALLKSELGLGHGDANAVAHFARGTGGFALADAMNAGDPLDEIYTGPKACLRPLHEQVMAMIGGLGEFEVAPKKGYVSLRRKKQFAMVGPATAKQIEIGLNAKGLAGSDRLKEQAPGGMCQYKIRLAEAAEIDAELKGWLSAAFESAG